MNQTLEKKVLERTAQLENVNKELESFSYSVSHDLRAPLRAIDGYARMIEEDYSTILDEEGKRLLGVVQYNAQKMGKLIDDLLSFSRLGRKEMLSSKVNMEEMISATINEIQKHQECNAEFKLGKLWPLTADYALMSQVVVNLISNAVKYSAKTIQPVVEIGSKKEDGNIIYYFRDNGAGFNMKYADKLFGVFQRLHRPEEFEGTGVGLAIVQRIISRHEGRVWAEGKEGEGATFYFSIPDKE
jgi:light-regulated signal transduction histidine kinase (bacteriophytochrome)